MDKQYLQHLTDTLTDKDNLKQCREEAASFHKTILLPSASIWLANLDEPSIF